MFWFFCVTFSHVCTHMQISVCHPGSRQMPNRTHTHAKSSPPELLHHYHYEPGAAAHLVATLVYYRPSACPSHIHIQLQSEKSKNKMLHFHYVSFFGSFCVHLNRIKLRLLFLHRPSYKLVLLGALAFFVWPTSLFCRLLSGRGFVHFCLLFRLNFCLCLSMESHGEMRGIS